MCYTSFEDSDLLQKHFASAHDNDTVNTYDPYESSANTSDIATNAVSMMNPAVESVASMKAWSKKEELNS